MSDTKTESFDTEYTDNPICPHCGDEDRDAWEWDLGPGLEGTGEVDATLERAQKAERERDEAQTTLTDIHRWIERNHPDGFIDSLTYLQNLERVTDDWYDRLDRLEVDACRFERERDEATAKLAQVSSLTESIVEKANALIARWDQPSWKDTAPTAGYINALRNAVEAYEKTPK